ncbi:MAG: hypothetical protein KDK66_07855 [Deltaproteobacteria bacterium]|nr:hypothetical protein [Deltaproteobacteria bacterium]
MNNIKSYPARLRALLSIAFALFLGLIAFTQVQALEDQGASASSTQDRTVSEGAEAAKEDFKQLGQHFKSFGGKVKGFFQEAGHPFNSEASGAATSSDGVVEKDLGQSPSPTTEAKVEDHGEASQLQPLKSPSQPVSQGSLDSVGNEVEEDVVF